MLALGGDKAWLRPVVAPDDFCSMAEKKEVGCHISAPKLLIMLEKLYGYAAAAEISVSALDEALAVINEAKREKRL